MAESLNESLKKKRARSISIIFFVILLVITILIQIHLNVDIGQYTNTNPSVLLEQLDYFKHVTNHSLAKKNQNKPDNQLPFRILHIVTSLDQYKNRKNKKFVKFNDRLTEIIIPALKGAVNSILQQPNWSVDVYLILGYNLSETPSRRKLVEDALPDSVSLEIWDEATPYGYDYSRNNGFSMIKPITRALARQHRYVIKDKLLEYDFFTVFEDDMRITSHNILAFKELSQQLDQMKEVASVLDNNAKPSSSNSISGPLTTRQLERVLPGFFRVEVLLEGSQSQIQLDPIPVDLEFNGKNQTVNPEYCCAVNASEQPENNILLPIHPSTEQLMTWETAIKGFSLRKFPEPIGWAAFLPGRKLLKPDQEINTYWSGEDGKLGAKPSADDGKLFGQQGGFMASRKQIIEFQRLCANNTFLPPFNKRPFRDDGLYLMNVEFWSGGFQLFSGGIGGCNLQRIIPIDDPDTFSKFLLYHTTNNKQIQRPRDRRVLVQNLLGQLNSAKKVAEKKL